MQEIHHDGSAKRTERWLFLDAGRRQIGTLSKPAEYDPRLRPWYRDARAAPEKIIRNVPYIFATTSQAGITLAKAFDGGAVGVDITLDRLMAYVRSVRLNEAHRFLAFDDERRLLAHSDPKQMFKPSGVGRDASVVVATVSDVSDPVMREAIRIFDHDGPFPLVRFYVAGADYLATIVRQVARDGGVFFVLYAAPLSDFMGTFADAAARSIPPALIIFILSLPAIAYLAHSISKPVMKLAGEADLIRIIQARRPDRLRFARPRNQCADQVDVGDEGRDQGSTKFVPKALVRDILQTRKWLRLVARPETSASCSPISRISRDCRRYFGHESDDEFIGLFRGACFRVLREQGTVDKFIGDAIFAFWNAPLPVTRHQHVACRTAR